MIDTAGPATRPPARPAGASGARLRPAPSEPLAAAARRRRRARRVRTAMADLLSVLAWSSTAFAVVLWVVTPSSRTITGVGSVITDAGIVAGLIGTDLTLVMLVLAARVPLIDRVFGQDNAIAVHRSLGKPVFYLLLAHGALLTLGYSAESATSTCTSAAPGPLSRWRTASSLSALRPAIAHRSPAGA